MGVENKGFQQQTSASISNNIIHKLLPACFRSNKYTDSDLNEFEKGSISTQDAQVYPVNFILKKTSHF